MRTTFWFSNFCSRVRIPSRTYHRHPRLPSLRATLAVGRQPDFAGASVGKSFTRRPSARHARPRNGHPVERPQRRATARLARHGQGDFLRRQPNCYRADGLLLSGERKIGRFATAPRMCRALANTYPHATSEHRIDYFDWPICDAVLFERQNEGKPHRDDSRLPGLFATVFSTCASFAAQPDLVEEKRLVRARFDS